MIKPTNNSQLAMNERFEHKKSLGQHFLNSDIVPQWLCDSADLKPADKVVEIGPGTGALTKELLKRGVEVVAIETDKRAIESLKKSFDKEIHSQQLRIVEQDVRYLNLSEHNLKDREYKIVANIPYYLSGFLFRTCLSAEVQPNTLVFLVQKEVAKRATLDSNKKEKESLLSLSVKVYGDPKYIKTVTKGHFTPPPKVDSAIIAITNISRENFSEVSEELFFTLLHLGFGQKRKQLLGNLAKNYPRNELINIFSTLKLEDTVRAEDISLEMWLKITKSIQNKFN